MIELEQNKVAADAVGDVILKALKTLRVLRCILFLADIIKPCGRGRHNFHLITKLQHPDALRGKCLDERSGFFLMSYR